MREVKSVYSLLAELIDSLEWALPTAPEGTKKARATRRLAAAQKVVAGYEERLKQPTLFGVGKGAPKHRSGDPDTAVAAAHVNLPGRRTQNRKIVHTVCVNPWGITNEEIGDLNPEICYDSLTTRTSECRDGGWIEDSGGRRKSRYGVEQIVWQPTLKALSHPELMSNGDQPPGINFSL